MAEAPRIRTSLQPTRPVKDVIGRTSTSELDYGMRTKLADVVLVCSNCHRMLHRRRPWLGIEGLKALLQT
jgi:hypothetical protein